MTRLVSVVLPIWNQADQVQAIVCDFSTCLASLGHGLELLLVVNGPQDDSLEACHHAARTHPGIRVVTTTQAGWGLAVKAGLAAAHGDLLCYTNSARTRGPDLAKAIGYAV